MAKKETKKEEAPVEEPKAEETKTEVESGLAKGEEYHYRLGMKFIRNIEEGTLRRVGKYGS